MKKSFQGPNPQIRSRVGQEFRTVPTNIPRLSPHKTGEHESLVTLAERAVNFWQLNLAVLVKLCVMCTALMTLFM